VRTYGEGALTTCPSPSCGEGVDSRAVGTDRAFCGRRFTTYERIEVRPIRVMKKEGRHVEFDRSKIMSGLVRACEKRPISTEALERTVSEIEQEVYSRYHKEVTSRRVGQLMIRKLRSLGRVACAWFASVYRGFKDVSEFVEEVKPDTFCPELLGAGRRGSP